MRPIEAGRRVGLAALHCAFAALFPAAASCAKASNLPNPYAAEQFASERLAQVAGALHAVSTRIAEVDRLIHEGPSLTYSGSSEIWCRDPDWSAGCSRLTTTRGSNWRELELDRGPDNIVKSIYFRAGLFPKDSEWSAQLEGQLGEDESFNVTFVRYAGDRESDRLILGSTTVFELDQSRVEIYAPPEEAPAWDTLQALANGSPADFSVWSADRLERLQTEAAAMLDEGRVERCAHGEYTGDKAVRCARIALPAAEIPARHVWVANELTRARDHIRTDAAVLHTLLIELAQTPK